MIDSYLNLYNQLDAVHAHYRFNSAKTQNISMVDYVKMKIEVTKDLKWDLDIDSVY